MSGSKYLTISSEVTHVLKGQLISFIFLNWVVTITRPSQLNHTKLLELWYSS